MSPPRALLFILAVWAAIYLPGLGTLEIKGEEGRRILPAVAMLRTGDYLVPQVGSEPDFRKPPLINWLVAASFKLTGQHNEWSARLPSALCVLAVALAFISIARRTLGVPGSLIGALIWMTNFGMIEKGRLSEIEALYVSLTGLAFICWLSWWQERRSPWLTWIVPWIVLGLGMLAKGPVHLVFFYAVVLAILWRAGELRRLWSAPHVAGVVIMLGIFAAWAIPCLLAMQSEGGTVAQTWTRQFSGRLGGEDFKFSGWILNIPRGLGYFLPWTLVLPFVWRGNAERRMLNAERRSDESRQRASQNSAFDVRSGLLWGAGISFLVISLLPGSLPRYTMPLLVPACWFAALLLKDRLRLVLIVTAAICVALLIYGFGATQFLQKREKVRNIAAQINAALPPDEPLYAVDPDYQPFLFYVREPIVYVSRVRDVPADAREVLVQPRDEEVALASQQWKPHHARPVLRLKDYRKKSVVLLRIDREM